MATEREVEQEIEAVERAWREKHLVKKEMPSGSYADVKEFDLDETCQDPNNQPTNGSLRLGDSRVVSQVRFLPENKREYASTGTAQMVAVDPFLHRDIGEANANSGPAGGAKRPVQGYVFDEPDADARGDASEGLGRGTDRTASPLAPSAGYQFPTTGEVGSRVIKRAAGIFTDLIMGRRK